ncbi:MAG: hypothetical protein FJ145_10575 [Deltaproteobacteria bacterium]|nr:hypothetical protein [Deltaproteobacteria bacterium]
MRHLEKALSLAEKQGRVSLSSAISSVIGRLYFQQQRIGDAAQYYEKSIQDIESFRGLIDNENRRQAYFEEGLGAYIGMIQLRHAEDRFTDAFNYNERSRSRVFLDLLGTRVRLSKEKADLADEERRLQRLVAEMKAQVDVEGGTTLVSIEAKRSLSAAERTYRSFLTRVRERDREQASLRTVEPLTASQVQKLLDPGQTLVEYFTTESEVFVWVVERKFLSSRRLALRKSDLLKQIKLLREQISNIGGLET